MGRPSSGTGPKTLGKPVAITNSLKNCSEQITPDCLRDLYKINYKPRSTDKNTFGIGNLLCLHILFSTHLTYPLTVEFTPQSYLASDLDEFFRYMSSLCFSPPCVKTIHSSKFSSNQVGVRPQTVLIDGGS